MKKRGQITLILIIVVGLFILFFLLFALKNKIVKTKNPDVLTDNALPVKSFVEQCLYKSTIKGLKLLGEQGGVIYREEGGLTPNLFKNGNYSVDYNNHHVFFSIIPGGIAYQRSCDPRDIGKAIYDFESCPSITYPFIGLNNPKISFKETDFDIPPNKNLRIFSSFSLPGLYPNKGIYVDPEMKDTQILTNPGNKIYNSLSAFIMKDMVQCLNYSKLKKRDYSVKKTGKMSIEPVFSDDFTQVNLEMPMTVLNLATDQLVDLHKFTAKVPIRFGKIYKYIRNILYQEAKDFTFNLSLVEKRDNDGIIMKLKKDVFNRIDIVNFTDKNSNYPSDLGMKNYSFYGSIPNSAPAISYFYTNISNNFIPGLKSYLLSCPQFPFHNPFEPNENKLMIKIGGRMNNDTVKCLFWAYNKTFSYLKWKPAYDPDDDKLTWSFKTKRGNWNQPILYSEANIIFDNYLMLNFSDGQYYDIETIPITLKNHKPIIKGLYLDSSYPSNLVYSLKIEDIDAALGTDVDVLTLSYSGDTGIIQFTPPVSTVVPVQGNNLLWPLTLKNNTGNYQINFTVTDKYGLSDSKLFTISI